MVFARGVTVRPRPRSIVDSPVVAVDSGFIVVLGAVLLAVARTQFICFVPRPTPSIAAATSESRTSMLGDVRDHRARRVPVKCLFRCSPWKVSLPPRVSWSKNKVHTAHRVGHMAHGTCSVCWAVLSRLSVHRETGVGNAFSHQVADAIYRGRIHLSRTTSQVSSSPPFEPTRTTPYFSSSFG